MSWTYLAVSDSLIYWPHSRMPSEWHHILVWKSCRLLFLGLEKSMVTTGMNPVKKREHGMSILASYQPTSCIFKRGCTQEQNWKEMSADKISSPTTHFIYDDHTALHPLGQHLHCKGVFFFAVDA